jgi:hypothetical protein
VEAVDEFESERDQEGDEQQNVRQIGCRRHAGGIDVDVNTVRHIENAGGQKPEEQDDGNRI